MPADQLIGHFGEGSFDVVVSVCVLEHIRDWRTALSTMKTYGKVRKPADFREADLSQHAFHSIVTGTRIRDLQDSHYRTPHFMKTYTKFWLKNAGLILATRVFMQV